MFHKKCIMLKQAGKIVIVVVISSFLMVSTYFYGKRESLGSETLTKKVSTPIDAMEANEMHDKWIVVTTVSPPTTDIEILATIPGWKLLVVGDTKTPANWSFPDCIYIGIEQQETLGYSIIDHIPYKSYTRKNIGYLYAIQHGAQFIYDTDDDNHPTNGKFKFEMEPITSGLIYSDSSRRLMNPYAHFGQPSIWPRGFPLDKVTQKNINTYRLTNFATPAIQQGLVNGDPDVDAIFRLIKRKQNMTSLNITFDHTAPPVTLPEGVFSPFNSQNTLFRRDAFWALMLPLSVSFRVTDIWRGYWTQRLMWLVGQQLAFFPPNAVQIRNPHNYLSDFREELQFYNQAGDFVEFLSSWKCLKKTFFNCVKQLSSDMVAEKFWNQTDANLVDAWLKDLESVGYRQPNLVSNHQKNETKVQLVKKISPPKADHGVYFSPKIAPESAVERRMDLLNYCDGKLNVGSLSKFKKKLEKGTSYSFPNLLMVVIFNFPFYKNIKYIDTLYREHFPNMLFCSSTDSYQKMIFEVSASFPEWRERQITFLNVTHQGGFYAYECIIRAIEMNYQVDGYLMVGDDIMFNTWNMKSLDVNRGYYQCEQRLLFNRNLTGAPHYRFPWWTYKNGKEATNYALDEIERLSLANSSDVQTRAMQTFVSNRMEKNLNMTMVSSALSDIYYIPRYQSEMVAEVLKVFLKYKVYTDIAVATTTVAFYGATAGDTIFSGESLWGGDRKKVLSFFNETKHYLHPMKFSTLNSDAKWKRDYCDIYIKRLIENW